MRKCSRCSLHNKFRYGFSYQITLQKLSPGSQHLLFLLKEHHFQLSQMQSWSCSHPFATLQKRWFYYPVTLPTSAILSVLFWLHLFMLYQTKASLFSKLSFACPCPITFSALWNRLSLLSQWLLPPASTWQKSSFILSATVSFMLGSNSLWTSPRLLITAPPLSTKISLLLQLGNDQPWTAVCWDRARHWLSHTASLCSSDFSNHLSLISQQRVVCSASVWPTAHCYPSQPAAGLLGAVGKHIIMKKTAVFPRHLAVLPLAEEPLGSRAPALPWLHRSRCVHLRAPRVY